MPNTTTNDESRGPRFQVLVQFTHKDLTEIRKIGGLVNTHEEAFLVTNVYGPLWEQFYLTTFSGDFYLLDSERKTLLIYVEEPQCPPCWVEI